MSPTFLFFTVPIFFVFWQSEFVSPGKVFRGPFLSVLPGERKPPDVHSFECVCLFGFSLLLSRLFCLSSANQGFREENGITTVSSFVT